MWETLPMTIPLHLSNIASMRPISFAAAAAWGVRCQRVPGGGKPRHMASQPFHLPVRRRARPMRHRSTANSRRSIRSP